MEILHPKMNAIHEHSLIDLRQQFKCKMRERDLRDGILRRLCSDATCERSHQQDDARQQQLHVVQRVKFRSTGKSRKWI